AGGEGMTQHVRRSYRKHRKTGWGVVLLAVSAVALFAIPFAHGSSPNRTLVFVTQPPSPAWQKGTTTTPALKLAVVQAARQVSVNGTLVLHVASGSAGTDADFSFGSAVTGATFWTFPDAKPLLSAPDGTYTLTATLGDLTATSNSFQVATEVCAGKSNCGPVGSNPAHPNDEGTGQVGINNTLNNPVVLQFAPVGGATPTASKCANWNQATYTDSAGNQVFFPTVQFGYATQTNKMLQVTYLIRNSEWVLTQATRGNQDAQFCVGARHAVVTNEN